MFPKVWELEQFQAAKVTFKVIQGHRQWCHLISHIRIRFLISPALQLYISILQGFRDIITYFTKLKDVK